MNIYSDTFLAIDTKILKVECDFHHQVEVLKILIEQVNKQFQQLYREFTYLQMQLQPFTTHMPDVVAQDRNLRELALKVAKIEQFLVSDDISEPTKTD